MNFFNHLGTNGNTLLIVSKDDLERAFQNALTSFMENMTEEMESKNDDDVLLSENEVIQKLGASHATLWRWKRIGYLPNIKIGRKVMWRQSDINKMLNR